MSVESLVRDGRELRHVSGPAGLQGGRGGPARPPRGDGRQAAARRSRTWIDNAIKYSEGRKALTVEAALRDGGLASGRGRGDRHPPRGAGPDLRQVLPRRTEREPGRRGAGSGSGAARRPRLTVAASTSTAVRARAASRSGSHAPAPAYLKAEGALQLACRASSSSMTSPRWCGASRTTSGSRATRPSGRERPGGSTWRSARGPTSSSSTSPCPVSADGTSSGHFGGRASTSRW